jgi:hypothetical protein
MKKFIVSLLFVPAMAQAEFVTGNDFVERSSIHRDY